MGIAQSPWTFPFGATVTSDAYNTLTNRLTSGNFGFDNNGNETTISPFTTTYDVENRQTGFTSMSNGTAAYTYDGDGRRVTKTTGGVTTTYVYDAKGDLAAEYSTQPPPPPCLTCYVTTDHLGSTRVVTDENAAVTARHDFLPFGEELTTSNRTSALGYGVFDNVMHKYTGQMRDLEGPGLDFFHARYFHGAQGRFTGSDRGPFVWRDPQTLNRYAYTRNNPLKFVDLTGNYFVVAAGMREQVKEYISTMLRSPQGSATVNAIAASSKPVSFDSASLPRVKHDDTLSVSAGNAAAVPGDAPGQLAGVQVKLDPNNISLISEKTGSSEFYVGLKAFAHEDQHAIDMLRAGTLQGAACGRSRWRRPKPAWCERYRRRQCRRPSAADHGRTRGRRAGIPT